MHKSEQINELATALSKAQAMIKGAVEDSTNPHFRSKYASLQAHIDASREALSKNGLSVMQLLTDMNCENMDLITLETVLMHSSGQWVSSTFSVPVSKKDAQGFGSAITYARRYAYAAALGIAPIDDDGHAAAQSAPAPSDDKAIPATVTKAIEAVQTVDELMAYAATQKKYHKNLEFRNLVSARKEVLNVQS